MKKIIGVVLLLTVGLLSVLQVSAEEWLVRSHSFDLGDIEEIEINNSVGSIDLRVVEGNEIRVEIEIEGEREGVFRRRKDVDHVDLEVIERGDKLILRIDERNIKADWFIELPAVSKIDIEMGVGEIDVEIGASALEIDLGVGEIDVYAPLASVGEIEVSSGVGEATISGTHAIEHSRSFVSAESEGRGEGDLDIDIQLGVGDVAVTLQ